MFAAASRLAPLAAKFCRQIVPPVVATLIAAGLISAYNRAFSGHLQQPRLSALHAANAAVDSAPPITTVGMTKPPKPPAPAPIETVTIYEETVAPDRLAEKDSDEEAGKDASLLRLATEPAPAPAPVRTAAPAPRAEPKAEPHRVATLEPAQPVVGTAVPVIVAVPPPIVAVPATAPVVAALPQVQQPYPAQVHPLPPYAPPQVIVGSAPMVTVRDRPNARPAEDAQLQPPPPPQGAIGKFVHAMKPSTWFAAARAFGDRIEATGNEILPSIRQ
jgi:hypothetical protein